MSTSKEEYMPHHNLAFDQLYKKDPGGFRQTGDEIFDPISPPYPGGYPEGYCEKWQEKLRQIAIETFKRHLK